MQTFWIDHIAAGQHAESGVEARVVAPELRDEDYVLMLILLEREGNT